MSAQVMDFPLAAERPLARRRAEVARYGTQMDFSTLLGKLERTLRWLDRHQIEVSAFACSTFRGAQVCARGPGQLRQLLRDEMYSSGHVCSGNVRLEQWRARDPSTGVLILWEEEASA